jgi:hypothetical protein
MLYKSTGTIKSEIVESYGPRLILEIDQGLIDYYFSLIPKYVYPRRQKYKAHISVVRKEIIEPEYINTFNKLNNNQIDFYYSPIIHFGEVYCWLNVFSTDLESLRKSLGLEVSSLYTLPPEGFKKCFHTTIANFKK